jgi:hypothetical protein
MTDFADMSTRDRDWRAYVDLGSGAVARKVSIASGGGGTNESGEPNGSYDAAEFTVSDGTTNYDVDSNQAGLWNDISSPSYFNLRTDQTVTVRFNDTSFPAITIASTDSPFIISSGLPITNVYVTNNSGNTANIKIFMY